MHFVEALGRALSGVLSPLAFEGSLIRGARLFHAEGVVYRADVRRLSCSGNTGKLAQRLEGEGLVRLSSAFFREENLPDFLGVALRIGRSQAQSDPQPSPDDQDLLFASTRSVARSVLSLLTTNQGDFLANDYYALTPFLVNEVGVVRLRLVAPDIKTVGHNRIEKLDCAVQARLAVLRLDARANEQGAAWEPVAAIDLKERIEIDQQALNYQPSRAGRGVRPIGFLNALRVAVYPASQLGRHLSGGPFVQR